MRFTIVVPCYQCVRFVGDCLRSVLAQRGDWECIVRVETSSDGTREEVLRVINGDARFTVLEGEPSGGPGASRNVGIDRARGDYVIFLDGDDQLEPEALVRLEPFLTERPDLAAIALDWGGGKVTDPWHMLEGTVSGPEAIVRQAAVEALPYAMTPQFVCRAAFLREQELRVVTGYHHEDEEFLPRVVYPAKTFVITHLPIYRYCLHEGSMMTASRERKVGAIARMMKSHCLYFQSQRAKLTQPQDRERFEAVARAWAKTWMTAFTYAFFHPVYASATPAEKTRAALRELFAEGTSAFDELLNYASFPRRLGAKIVKFAARTGWLLPAKIYYRLYYLACERRSV